MARWNSRSEIRKVTGSSCDAACAARRSRSRASLGLVDAQGRVGDDLPLDQEARRVHRLDRVAVDQARLAQPGLDRADIGRGDAAPDAMRHLDDAAGRQDLKPAADRDAAHLKGRREVALARQDIADLQHAGGDEGGDLVGDDIAHRVPHHGRSQLRNAFEQRDGRPIQHDTRGGWALDLPAYQLEDQTARGLSIAAFFC